MGEGERERDTEKIDLEFDSLRFGVINNWLKMP